MDRGDLTWGDRGDLTCRRWEEFNMDEIGDN
jgi:hypothetical protein